MFEEQLEEIRAKMQKLDKSSGQYGLCRCATPAQIAGFETKLGLSLPDEYREFLLHLGDGCWGIQTLFEENKRDLHWQPVPLVVFPLRQTEEDKSWLCDLVRWDDLSGHEKMQSDVALRLALDSGVYFRALVISGPQRDQVWSSANRLNVDSLKQKKYDGLSFLDWIEKVLSSALS